MRYLDEKIFRLFAIIAAVLFIIQYSAKKSIILVIHSYNTDYAWVKDINKGIDRVLEKQKSYIVIKHHYMDTKNHPKQEEKVKAGKITREIIDILKPSVIIAVDDDAQKYVATHYINDPKIKIVFAGMNSNLEKYGYDKANNVTGCLERIPLDAIVEFLEYVKLKIAADRHLKVIHVHDISETVMLDNQRLKDYKNWGTIELLPSLQAQTFAEWKAAIKKAQKTADVILLSNYRKIFDDTNSKLIHPDEIINWTFENCERLILGLNGFVTEDGAAFSIGSSPFEQGEEVMEMALEIFNQKKKLTEIPIKRTTQYIVSIRQDKYEKSYLKKGVNLPKSYEALARAVGKYMIDKK